VDGVEIPGPRRQALFGLRNGAHSVTSFGSILDYATNSSRKR
jgi:hypothetical protein